MKRDMPHRSVEFHSIRSVWLKPKVLPLAAWVLPNAMGREVTAPQAQDGQAWRCPWSFASIRAAAALGTRKSQQINLQRFSVL
jgi:hypothetical protein